MITLFSAFMVDSHQNDVGCYLKNNGVLWKSLLGQEHLLLHTRQEMKANAQQIPFL